MLRLYDITSRTSTGVSFSTYQMHPNKNIAYVVYDTSTGISGMEDYYTWRAMTSTGNADAHQAVFTISNSVVYPTYTDPIPDYRIFSPKLLNVCTFQEAQLIENLITRIDMVRKRLPNPGRVVSAYSSVGQDGVVSEAGGYEKKFSIKELIQFIEGAIVEINIHPPATVNYWWFTTDQSERSPNPYNWTPTNGVPYKWMDLIVQGAMIRALIAWGILEVDVHFSTSDNGLQITYDRVGYVSSWFDKILAEFKAQKDLVKWDSVNSMGTGVGTIAFAATGFIGAVAGQITQNGILPMNSLMGFSNSSFTPM